MTDADVFLVTWDLDRHQYFLIDLPEPDFLGDLSFEGKPKEPVWTPPPIYSEKPRLERPDIWHVFGIAGLVMELRVVDLLEPFLSPAGELLPMVESGSSDTFYAHNILQDIDCIDPAVDIPGELSLPPALSGASPAGKRSIQDPSARRHEDLLPRAKQ